MAGARVVAITADDVALIVDTEGRCVYGAWDVNGGEHECEEARGHRDHDERSHERMRGWRTNPSIEHFVFSPLGRRTAISGPLGS